MDDRSHITHMNDTCICICIYIHIYIHIYIYIYIYPIFWKENSSIPRECARAREREREQENCIWYLWGVTTSERKRIIHFWKKKKETSGLAASYALRALLYGQKKTFFWRERNFARKHFTGERIFPPIFARSARSSSIWNSSCSESIHV